MQMFGQVKEKAPEREDGPLPGWTPRREEGFLVRDLLRFFAVDLILVILVRLFRDLGLFPSIDVWVGSVLLSKVLLFGYLMWLIRDRRHAWPETGGASWGSWKAWLALPFAYAAYFLAMPFIDEGNSLVMQWLYDLLERPYERAPQDIIVFIFEDIVSLPLRLVLVFFTIFAGPVMEELAFRGMGLDGFRRRYGIVLSVLLTSLLFGLYHFSLPLVLPLAALGVVFALIRLLSGSLWCAAAFHCFHNALALGITAWNIGLFREWFPG